MDKISENRLRWFELRTYMLKGEETEVLRAVMRMIVQGRKRKSKIDC